jgi:hypothetical protein
MITDLEAKKAVNNRKRFSIVSGYSQLCTVLGILCFVGDLAFQSLHVLYPWRNGCMNKHRNSKVALGELYCDHRQMLTDGFLASCVSGFVALYLYCTAVSKEMEMMGRLLVTKPIP